MDMCNFHFEFSFLKLDIRLIKEIYLLTENIYCMKIEETRKESLLDLRQPNPLFEQFTCLKH